MLLSARNGRWLHHTNSRLHLAAKCGYDDTYRKNNHLPWRDGLIQDAAIHSEAVGARAGSRVIARHSPVAALIHLHLRQPKLGWRAHLHARWQYQRWASRSLQALPSLARLRDHQFLRLPAIEVTLEPVHRQPNPLCQIEEDVAHRDAAALGEERAANRPIEVIGQGHVLEFGALDRLESGPERYWPLAERRVPRLPRQVRLGQHQEWAFTIQRQLGRRLVVDVLQRQTLVLDDQPSTVLVAQRA